MIRLVTQEDAIAICPSYHQNDGRYFFEGLAVANVGQRILPRWITFTQQGLEEVRLLLLSDRRIVVHNTKLLYFLAWSEPVSLKFWEFRPNIFDTVLTLAARSLGLDHHRDAANKPDRYRLRDLHEQRLNLANMVNKMEIPVKIGVDIPNQVSQAEAMGVAEATANLYATLLSGGTPEEMGYLAKVEFPFSLPNARMQFRGLRLDLKEAQEMLNTAVAGRSNMEAALRASLGLVVSCSWDGVKALLGERYEGWDLDNRVECEESGIPELSKYASVEWSLEQTELLQRLVETSRDGRVFPKHIQLGASTGRNVCRDPEATNLSRDFRHLFIADEGHELIYGDFGQIEPYVLACLAGDDKLQDLYHIGDFYEGVSRVLEIPPTCERSGQKQLFMSLIFKADAPKLRDIMLTAGVTRTDAVSTALELSARFRSQFPAATHYLDNLVLESEQALTISIVPGLSRHVHAQSTSRRRTIFVATRIQGVAAIIMKETSTRLINYLPNGAELLTTVHDSYLVQSTPDLSHLSVMAMRKAMEEGSQAVLHAKPAKPRIYGPAPHWPADT